MAQAAEAHLLTPRLWLWHAFDPAVKADLFSTAALVEDALFLIDPIRLDSTSFQELRDGYRTGGILVSNANHLRATVEFARVCQAPVFCSSVVASDLEGLKFVTLTDGAEIASGVSSIALKGAARGEFAFHFADDNGTIVVGDALIHVDPYGFALLPAKYCENQKDLKQSLQRLLRWPFERLLFAHGMPILSGAHERLEHLLR